jgi:hypothetical protein
MSLYTNYATDRAAELEGTDVSFGTNADGTLISFRLRRMSRTNTFYTKALNKATQPVAREIELDTLDDKRSDELMLDVFLDSVLVGWTGVRDRNDKPLEYSKEAAKQLFTDLPDLYSAVQDAARRAGNFREKQREADAKN